MMQIDACKNGDKDALGELYTTYANRLLGVCRHYVKDDNVAEDILHDAFIVIFMSIRDLKDKSKLEGWMTTIVRNLCLKYLQSTGKDTIPLSHLDIELKEDAREEHENIDLELLFSAIESLPEGNREVFKLSALDGLSHKEIGEQLGINPHSSSSQLFRAKKTLRSILTKYWMLLLLPIMISVYVYFIQKDKSVKTSENKPIAIKHNKNTARQINKELEATKTDRTIYSTLSKAYKEGGSLSEKAISDEQFSTQISTDSMVREQRILAFDTDSLQKHLAIGGGTYDSLLRIPHISLNNMVALNEGITVNNERKKKYPWTFNLGYSSNAGTNEAMSNMNYLSLVDYANGGATAKLYNWTDLESYYDRNKTLMDSVERAKMSLILHEHTTDDNSELGETAHHSRPKTFGLSVNKQLGKNWIFSTGIAYTKLRSDFESTYHNAQLIKTQKIDYVGIPLRLTYRIWGKGRFMAYTTGGVTFEMPVRSSLEKKFIIKADSSYTLRGDIKARYQWSVNFGVGVQYKIFKPFSLYLEPNMFYYFKNNSGIETYRTEHPFIITVPFGLRFTW